MKNFLFFTLFLPFLMVSCHTEKQEESEYNIKELAKEAYIYAFPAVEHNKAIWSVLKANNIPPNRFFGNTQLFTHENTAVVSPNNDTFYSYAVCDIRYEPLVISVPLIKERYFSIQLCDIFTNCPEYVSTLVTGEGPGNYLIAGRDWEGEIPAGIDKVIKIPATVVLAIARTQVFGPQDEQAAPIARSYAAVPLSEFTGTPSPQSDALAWPLEMFNAKTGDCEGFFKIFNTMLQYQILNATDKALMKKFEAIGLGTGKGFSRSQFDTKTWEAIEAGANEGKSEITARLESLGTNINNWKMSPANAGRWGTDYMTNAAAAWKYIYVNTPEEAIYFTVDRDGGGELLNGENNYTITFSAQQIPHPRFFWSLTMYNDKGFLVENQTGRYNIKDIDDLTYHEDGSLTLYIQKENPGPHYQSNWLPAPEGQFYMILRMYGPSEETIRGEIEIPAVDRTNN